MSDHLYQTLMRRYVIDNIFPESNTLPISQGVYDALTTIEDAVGERHGDFEWCALGLAEDGVVSRLAIPRQTVYRAFFSATVDDDRAGLEIQDAINETQEEFPSATLLSLIHSHNNFGVGFSKDDEDAFPGFLGYIDQSRSTDPIEFSRGSYEVTVQQGTLIFTHSDSSKPTLTMCLDSHPELSKGISNASLAFSEYISVADGFSLVLDRDHNMVCYQGFNASPPVSSDKIIHRKREGVIEVVEVVDDYRLTEEKLDDILDNKLHLPKPVKQQVDRTQYWTGSPKETSIEAPQSKPKRHRLKDSEYYHQFAADVFDSFARFDWSGNNYTAFLDSVFQRIESGLGLTQALAHEVKERGLYSDPDPVTQPKIARGKLAIVARNMLADSTPDELEFVRAYCVEPMGRRDELLERYVQERV